MRSQKKERFDSPHALGADRGCAAHKRRAQSPSQSTAVGGRCQRLAPKGCGSCICRISSTASGPGTLRRAFPFSKRNGRAIWALSPNINGGHLRRDRTPKAPRVRCPRRRQPTATPKEKSRTPSKSNIHDPKPLPTGHRQQQPQGEGVNKSASQDCGGEAPAGYDRR